MKAEKVLVTGSAGFIGFHVAKRLLQEGRHVLGLDNMNSYYDVDLTFADIEELAASTGFRPRTTLREGISKFVDWYLNYYAPSQSAAARADEGTVGLNLGSTVTRSWESVELKREGYQVEIAIGGQPFADYHFDPAVAKPYLSPLRSAQGTIVTRGFPMVTDLPGEDRDEPHQRAMYFAHGDINGFDFWGEAAFPRWSHTPASKFGRTVFRKLDVLYGGPESGELKAEFDLVTAWKP